MPRLVKSAPWLKAVTPGSAAESTRRPLTDAQLIEGIVQGDSSVAGAFHDQLVDVIDHTLFRVLGRRETDHEDLIQVCFEQVLRTLIGRSFAGDCSLRTWTGRITTHVALNTLRSRVRERRVFFRADDAEGEPAAPVDATSQTHAHLDLGRARRVLSKMRPAKSEVLVLHDVHGYNLNEIAGLLDITVAAAQSRLVRGRAEFRRRLTALDSRATQAPTTDAPEGDAGGMEADDD
jgi:RNA polymerase sigma-70 factor, ECF subfamily